MDGRSFYELWFCLGMNGVGVIDGAGQKHLMARLSEATKNFGDLYVSCQEALTRS
jgi:hypothetical protein